MLMKDPATMTPQEMQEYMEKWCRTEAFLHENACDAKFYTGYVQVFTYCALEYGKGPDIISAVENLLEKRG